MDSIRDVYKIVVKYIEHHRQKFSLEQIDAAAEIKRRLLGLENSFNRLTNINEQLSKESMPQISLDSETGIMTVELMGQSVHVKYERAEPDVPVSFLDGPALVRHDYTNELSDDEIDSQIIEALKIEMESLVEHYYYNAFKITKLIQILTGKSRYDCRCITMVRNYLIEHPKLETIYSFGFGVNGPFIKPVQRGEVSWEDAGLVKNTEFLISSLKKVFSSDQ